MQGNRLTMRAGAVLLAPGLAIRTAAHLPRGAVDEPGHVAGERLFRARAVGCGENKWICRVDIRINTATHIAS